METVRAFKTYTALICLWLAGCTHIGPGTILSDRTALVESLGSSWNKQLLLDLVKVRYMEFPVFVDVGQIVAGYTLGSASQWTLTRVFGQTPSSDFQTLLNIFGAGTYSDRPTITYTPLTGARFQKNLMSPIPPRAILFMLQAGYAADLILGMCVDSINDLQNRSVLGGRWLPGNPGFFRLIELLRNLQAAGGIRMIIRQDKEKGEAALIAVGEKRLDPESEAAVKEIEELLGVRPGLKEYKVVYGNVPGADDEVAMLTRSVLRILIELASHVEVPEEHLEEGRALRLPLEEAEKEGAGKHLITIRSGKSAPADALVAMHYRGYWFWIDDKDLMSKRTFAAMVLFFTISEVGEQAAPPVLTIPTQ